MAEKVLEIRGLCKDYPAFHLKDVSFSLERGRIMGFIGRNGAGKTTTLKSALNIVHPAAGELKYFGLDFAENELEIKRRIAFVSGGANYYPNKKLAAITAVTRSFYEHWDEAAYRRYLKLFNLDESKTPKALSAGMQVKYALALALSHGAELLILDEPTSGLDPVSRDELVDVFLSLADEGVSILFSTHITDDLDKCADDVTYIRNGEIVFSLPIGELREKYRAVAVTAEQAEKYADRLIGCKRAKEGFTALVERGELEEELPGRAAGLEEIMVHLDKEARDDG
jgi:ABC-2 type transport system ATP-binding protein